MAVTPFTIGMTGTTEISPATAAILSASFQAPLVNRLYSQISLQQLAPNADKTAFTFGRVLPLSLSGGLPLLQEYTDPDSTPLVAASTTLNAIELGRVVTVTDRLDAISGGNAGRQAAAAVGADAALVLDYYAASVLGAGTNAAFAGAGTSAGLTATDVMSPALFNRAYAALSKSGAQKTADGYYLAMLTTDQITDLKNATGAGSWTDIFKYSQPDTIMQGEVGTAFGFKVIENNLLPVVNQTSGTVDVSKAIFFGVNALGQGVSRAPQLGVAFTDKMNRFAHYSWHALMVMGIIDQSHVFVVNTATAGGNNAA